MGRAVVSTTIGAEGLDVVYGQHLLLADDPRSFASSVLRLIEEPERCVELAGKGRRLVERRYGWDALADRFGGFIREVAGQRAPANLIGELAGQPAAAEPIA
jgi:glycosyltransferase involved in cell wall biosynthesis